jgi:hypothetical protein
MVAVSQKFWMPDRLLRCLLTWTAVTTLPFWLVSVRGAFDGASYEWRFLGFVGSGISSDYWFPLLAASVVIIVRYVGWRGAYFPFHLVLAGWHLFLACGAMLLAVTEPEGFRFRGDTLGIDVSLAVIGPLFFGLWAGLTLFWVTRDLWQRRPRHVLPWCKRNTRWMLILAALLPLQFALLRFGEPGSTFDQIGVLITIAQWLLLGLALAPRGSPASAA